MKRLLQACLRLAATCLIANERMAFAAPGDLDASFGTGGKATTPIGSSTDGARSVAMQSDGKIVVAGFAWNGSDHDFALVCYTASGVLDASFGTGGKVTTPIAGGYAAHDQGYSVAVQSDRKIVVAGTSSNGSNGDFALVRYTASGALDASFGTGGKVTTDFGSSYDYGQSVAVQSDGKIVVAGHSFIIAAGDEDFALARYTASGALDASFGTGGKVTTPIGSGYDLGQSVAVQSDGKIVVAGTSSNGSNYDIALVRYTASGVLDASFGTGGKVTTPIAGGYDYGQSVAVQSDGKIVVAGYSHNGSDYDIALVRYTISGALDGDFGTGGKVTTPIGSGDDRGNSVAVHSDGKIVVAGRSFNGSNYDFALVRYTASGVLDASFGTGGKVTTPVGISDEGHSVAVQGDGKIVVAGSSYDGSNYDFALARYEGDSTPVLFIPGITGSRLIGGGATGKHGNNRYLWPTIGPDDLDALNLQTGATDVQAVDIVRAYVVGIYAPFVEQMVGPLGYREFDLDEDPTRLTSDYMLNLPEEEKPTFFVFPYDWRRSNASHVATLRQYIQRIRQLHGGSKINVVAHSMGGLLLRRYMLDSPDAAEDIAHVMTVGSPFWGAPQAHYKMLSGNFYGPGLLGDLIDMVTRRSMRQTMASMPGVHELLVADLYLANGGWPVMSEDRWDLNNDHVDNNGVTAPAYTANEFRAVLDARTARELAPLIPASLPSTNSLNFHDYQGGRQDNWSADTGDVKYFHICGKQASNATTTNVVARSRTFVFGLIERNRFVPRSGEGDGTVPLLSAKRLSDYLAPGSPPPEVISGPNGDVAHTALTRHPRTFELMTAFFGDAELPPAPLAAAFALAEGAGELKQRVSITGAGYVYLRDAQGNDNALLSSIAAKKIPGVEAEYGGDEPWVDLTLDAGVDLTILGAATDGPLEITVVDVASDGSSSRLRRYRFVPTGHLWQAHLSPADADPRIEPQVAVDADDSGVYEVTEYLVPTHSSGAGAADDTAPLVGLSLTASAGSIVATLSAQDNVPGGVARYTLNDGSVQDFVGPISFGEGQNMVLKAYAEDAMGNTSGLVTTVIRPTLGIQGSTGGGAVVLEWPIADAYVLEEAPDLSGPWTRSAAQVSRGDFSESAVVPIGSDARKFFRLRSQTITR